MLPGMRGAVADLDKLDDPHYPAFPTAQAAKVLGVQEAFLRNLDTAGLVRPERSEGGHRRYSRRQLTQVARLREQLDQGHTLAAAGPHHRSAGPAGRHRAAPRGRRNPARGPACAAPPAGRARPRPAHRAKRGGGGFPRHRADVRYHRAPAPGAPAVRLLVPRSVTVAPAH
ncbi:helix-turn-helix domain-containing protein [Amycolatopsis methanolica]|nr:helix-turn-helix domain-containing protein [Amycolatopsis methanolica]